MMKTPTMAVQADHGRWFAVRYLPVGARYGRTNNLVVRPDEGALVEFWDLTVADDADRREEGFGPLGQIVTRYFVTELLARDGSTGLCLDSGHRDIWSIDALSMIMVLGWIRRTRAELRHARS